MKFFRFLVIPAICFGLAGFSFAQDSIVTDSIVAPEQAAPVSMSEYWLGIQCAPVPPLLKLHLNLEENEGVLVEAVVPESPAAKANIEPTDILIKIGDATVGSVEDIMKKVDTVKETETAVTVIHKGSKTELQLTPEKRPENAKPVTPPMNGTFRSMQPGIIIDGFDDSKVQELPKEIQQMLEQARKQMEQFDNDRGFFRHELPSFPGTSRIPGFSQNADRIEVSIYPKSDNSPGGLTVKKNDQTWDVSNFADLPKDIQEDVKQVLEPSTHGAEVGEWVAKQIAAGNEIRIYRTFPKQQNDNERNENSARGPVKES